MNGDGIQAVDANQGKTGMQRVQGVALKGHRVFGIPCLMNSKNNVQ